MTRQPTSRTGTSPTARTLQDRGLILARGPLTDQDDERFRGFSIWSTDPATARAHAEATAD